jgi:hypothetical protein
MINQNQKLMVCKSNDVSDLTRGKIYLILGEWDDNKNYWELVDDAGDKWHYSKDIFEDFSPIFSTLDKTFFSAFNGNKIEMIKFIRYFSGLGLVEAKMMAEWAEKQFEEKHPLNYSQVLGNFVLICLRVKAGEITFKEGKLIKVEETEISL